MQLETKLALTPALFPKEREKLWHLVNESPFGAFEPRSSEQNFPRLSEVCAEGRAHSELHRSGLGLVRADF